MIKQSILAMNKLITFSSFAIVLAVVLFAFITTKTYTQLTLAVLLFPFLAILTYKILPKRFKYETEVINSKLLSPSQSQEVIEPAKESEEDVKKTFGISDFDKRTFLKLIGGAGITLFLFSLFSKKGEGIFFKNIPGQSSFTLEDTKGNKVDPAQSQPLDGYILSDFEDSDNSYYGFTNKNGGWYIMRVDLNIGTFRYIKGESDFVGSWSNREKLRYDYYNLVFNQSSPRLAA